MPLQWKEKHNYTIDYRKYTVIPVVRAGGSMSAYAYTHFTDPVVVEHVQAHAGIDIGQTLIGMQLQPVAVPIRLSIKENWGSNRIDCENTSEANWRRTCILRMNSRRNE